MTSQTKNAITYELTTYLCSRIFKHLLLNSPVGSTEARVSKPA